MSENNMAGQGMDENLVLPNQDEGEMSAPEIQDVQEESRIRIATFAGSIFGTLRHPENEIDRLEATRQYINSANDDDFSKAA